MTKSYRRRTKLLNILLFSVIGSFSYMFLVYFADIPEGSFDLSTSLQVALVVFVGFIGLGTGFSYINNRINNTYPDFLQERKRIMLYFIFVGLLIFILNYFLLVFVKHIIDAPNPFSIKLIGIRMLFFTWLIELIVVSQIMVNNFYKHLIFLYKKTAVLKESSIKAQYQALQSQLNPHFLFNSLNTLISEIEYNPTNAALFTRHLSDVYRYILQCENHKLVTLSSELNFLNSFIFLHQVRLGNCIQIVNQVDPAYFGRKVPPLTLQLLAENVVKHNVITQANHMEIVLTYEPTSSFLAMKNKIMPKKNLISSGKGLKNLSSRYRLLCNRDIIIEKDNNYFTVKVLLIDE